MKENSLKLYASPENWKWSEVGEITEVITGNTPSKKEQRYYGNYIPFVKPPELQETWIFNADDNLSIEGANVARVIPKNSVLVSCIGNLGKTGINKIPVAFNQQINAMVFPDYINPVFGFYYFQSYEVKKRLEKLASATTVSIVNKTKFSTIPFPVPPLEEQDSIVKKIEELFTQLDAGVAELQEAKARLERYRQSVLKAAVTGELTREWREAHQDQLEPAEQLLERILEERRAKWEEEEWAKLVERAKKKAAQKRKKEAGLPYYIRDLEPEDWEHIEKEDYQQYLPKDNKWKSNFSIKGEIDRGELPQLPSGWIWTFFEQISDGSKNAIKAGPFGSSLKKEFYTESGYKIYGQEQVIGQSPYIGDYYIDDKKFRELESCSVKPGDILISLVGTIGKVLILPDGIEPGIINPRLVKLSLNNKFTLNKYIKTYLYSHSAKEYFQLSSHGGTMDILNLTILSKLPIPLPNIEEQKKIVQMVDRRVSIANEIEKEVENEILRSKQLRQSILKQAFEGKLLYE